ncbi:hypothetical protein ACVWW2_002103 [Bradyrhizobium sp. LM4.3]
MSSAPLRSAVARCVRDRSDVATSIRGSLAEFQQRGLQIACGERSTEANPQAASFGVLNAVGTCNQGIKLLHNRSSLAKHTEPGVSWTHTPAMMFENGNAKWCSSSSTVDARLLRIQQSGGLTEATASGRSNGESQVFQFDCLVGMKGGS